MLFTRRQCLAALVTGAASSALRAQVQTVPACLGRLAGARVDVDVHCHIFNGSDLQVERFLSRVVAGEFPPVLKKVMETLGPPLQRAVWRRAPVGERELGKLERFGSGARLHALSPQTIEEWVAEDRREADEAYSEGFAEALTTVQGRAFLGAYKEYLQTIAAEDPAVERALGTGELSAELEVLAEPEALLRQLDTERRLVDFSLHPVFTFVRRFFEYRYVNAYDLLRNYGCEHGSVQLIAAAVVDYDHPLGAGSSPPPTPLPVQFRVMSRIAEVFGGRVLPYLPFDPWRLVLEGPALFDLMRDYLARGEAVGVKLYPPLGFAPFGNEQLLRPPPSWPEPKFGRKLDQAMTAFWDFTTQLDVPVIAHAGRSNSAAADFLTLGNPDNWGLLLDRYPEARVCFGHFGGQELLQARHEWPLGFLGLAAKYPQAFGDFSYFSEVLSRLHEPALRKRIARFLATSAAAEEKAVYGSDWTMLAIERRSERYFERFARLLGDSRQFKSGVADRVLSANALRFLGLRPGQLTRRRLEGFYRQREIHAPWLQRV